MGTPSTRPAARPGAGRRHRALPRAPSDQRAPTGTGRRGACPAATRAACCSSRPSRWRWCAAKAAGCGTPTATGCSTCWASSPPACTAIRPAPIRDAVVAALDGGISLSSHTLREAELAREIVRRFPSMELLRFTNSGTEANLLALAAAVAHTGRRKVLVFDGAYHGGVLSFGGAAGSVNVPHDWLRAPLQRPRRRGRASCARDGDQIAAILVEPMLGSGGCIPGTPRVPARPAPAGRRLRRAAGVRRGHDLAPVAWAAARRSWACVPDLTTLGKYFGGGLSFGAFGGRRELMQRFDPRRADALGHAGTFNNNVLTHGRRPGRPARAVDARGHRGAQPARRSPARALQRAVRARAAWRCSAAAWAR